jgi:tetratricopeptide (TPR) repeat protein
MYSSKPDVHLGLEAAKSVFSSMNWIPGQVLCDTVLAELELQLGNLLVAKGLLKRSFHLSWGYDSEGMSNSLERLADISRWGLNNIDSMSSWVIVFLAYGLDSHSRPIITKALRSLGDLFLLWGEEDTAHSLFTVSLEGFTQMDIHQGRAVCLNRLGDISKQRGNLQKAIKFWREAHPLFEKSSQRSDITGIDLKLASTTQAMLNK